MNPKLLRLKSVKEKTGLSTTSIERLMSQGKFPKQIKISERAVAWLEKDVNDWIEKKVAEAAEHG